MMEELRRHGYDVGPGTLYTMLQKVEPRQHPPRGRAAWGNPAD
jgi:hypothetical protein